ncbi:AAA family ATPase [Acetobacter indonesiensis]|uniref:AAA family ATPase n=1 Tax=Acetobacter indonesiensis TaxID=104101 RepID=UPI001F1F8E82|nr:AAA family ATPase [Acetobacter indonesiensis]MCG0996406.1 AAA family ATPase [Acetobacter indonesiensis]
MTSRATLKSLMLTAFRGSAGTFKLDFEKGKKLTLIYGENGTGKTTICDAFEFLAFERIGSLEDRGMGKGLEKFWPTAGKPVSALLVELETSMAKCTGKIVNKKVAVSPLTSRPRIELLRQRQILELIQAQPAKRYEAIKRFIDIEAFERSEESLRQLGKSLGTEKQTAIAAEQENLTTLQSFYEAAGSPVGLNAVTWAKQKLAAPTAGLDADIAAITKLRTAFHALTGYPQKMEDKRNVITSAQAAVDAADQAQSAALATVDNEAAERLNVLTAGDVYLHDHPDAKKCPLCDSVENASGLHQVIKAKLAQLATLTAATTKWKQAHHALNVANTALQQVEADYQKGIITLAAAQAAHTWKPEVRRLAAPAPADSAVLPTWLTANQGAAANWADVEASWHDESKFRAQLKSATERYESNATRVAELTALIPKAEKALAECVEERQKFTDGIISEIAKEVGKLYEKVHPGEGLDKIALELDPARRASLSLGATFEGHEAPPQAYFSQSHLDTLGICVFLALAARDRASDTVLILDDVLGSIDEPHVERVIGMIYEVSADFQHTIVTTHYRPWREKYRWGWLKPGQACQFVELTGWAIDDGIRIISSLPEVERLRSFLAESPLDPQAICSKAGVILEAVLDYLTQKYECAVPRRHGAAYTLGDLLPAINGKLRDALKVEIRDGLTDASASPTSTVALKPILDELTRIAQARNAFGAHFKAISFELLDTDAVGFAKNVMLLVDALTHPEHGWPSNDKSGSYWRNSRDSRRLHPLKKPG